MAEAEQKPMTESELQKILAEEIEKYLKEGRDLVLRRVEERVKQIRAVNDAAE